MSYGLARSMAASVLTKPKTPLIAIIGSTGTGKSQLAVDIARCYNGEIINGDAMQLYQGLDVITNKIPIEEQQGIPHHLLGCIGIKDQPWTAVDFLPRTITTIKDIFSRDKVPILVGGTHYYLQSLLFRHALAESKAAHDSKSSTLEEQASEKAARWPIVEASTEEIFAKLREVDPVMAQRWHPNDRRKIQRSLEIWLSTGRPASEVYRDQQMQKSQEISAGSGESGLRFPTLILWAYTPRPILDARLDARVHTMLVRGLLDEVRTLDNYVKQNPETDQTRGIWQSIGYKQFLPYIHALHNHVPEKNSLADGIEQTQAGTRQYSRRQERWIRIKLMNALRDAGAQNVLFAVDTSRPDAWPDSVLAPALRCCDAFLAGKPLPDPESVFGGDVSDILRPLREYDVGQRADTWGSWTCEMCNITVTMKEQWQKHLQGRKHRKMAKKAAANSKAGEQCSSHNADEDGA